MSYLLWRNGDPSLASTRRLIAASEVSALDTVHALTEQLAAERADVARDLAQAREQARLQGYAAGLAEGRAAALQEARRAAAVAFDALARERMQSLQAARTDLALLALQITRKLIGRLPEAEQLALLAQEAARQSVPEGGPVRLSVHPEHEAAVRALLPEGGASPWQVDGDAALPREACRVHTAHSDADASLQTQLARLARGWSLPWPAPEGAASPGAASPGAAPASAAPVAAVSPGGLSAGMSSANAASAKAASVNAAAVDAAAVGAASSGLASAVATTAAIASPATAFAGGAADALAARD